MNSKINRHLHDARLIVFAFISLLSLVSCRTVSLASHQDISAIADRVWYFSQSHTNGFTLYLRTMTEPKEGIAVSYAETQNSHSRSQLDKVVRHALQNDGYVGGWYNADDGLYYFDSSRLFHEDSLHQALQFGKEHSQKSVFILSSKTEVPIQ